MRTFLLLVLFMLEATATEANVRERRRTEWGYDEHNGPETWPDNFPKCGGINQSPVAIFTREAVVNFPAELLSLNNYEAVPKSVTLTNTGHTVQVSMDVDASVTGGMLPGEYIFHQFHFHWGSTDTRGSEHTVDGIRFAGELHLVHYRRIYGSLEAAMQHCDGLVVLGVMLQQSYNDNPYLHTIVNSLGDILMPHELTFIHQILQQSSQSIEQTFTTPIVLRNLLPNNIQDYYSYNGSLTTPTCNEVVTWIVFRQTIPISSNQLKQFRQLLNEDGSNLQDNYRTLQLLNSRKVYRTWISAHTPSDNFITIPKKNGHDYL